MCPNCGEPSHSGDRFCAKCGTLLAEAAAAAGPASEDGRPGTGPTAPGASVAPVSERRVCSVLFADLVGFTSLSEARDPEEVREVLSRYFEVARTLITRYGGVVEKFIGDTERAVRAALELVGAVQTLRRGHEEAVRAGHRLRRRRQPRAEGQGAPRAPFLRRPGALWHGRHSSAPAAWRPPSPGGTWSCEG